MCYKTHNIFAVIRGNGKSKLPTNNKNAYNVRTRTTNRTSSNARKLRQFALFERLRYAKSSDNISLDYLSAGG